MYIATLLLISLAFLLNPSQAYKPCIDYPSAKVDEAWFLGVKKWYAVGNSGCLTCENDEDWKWLFGRANPKTICYDIKMWINGSPVTLKTKCQYVDIGTQSCEVDTTSLPADKRPGYKGVKKTAATNNKTWIAYTLCIYGKEQAWVIISTVENLPDADKKAAMDGLEKLGFDVKSNGGDKLKFGDMDQVPC